VPDSDPASAALAGIRERSRLASGLWDAEVCRRSPVASPVADSAMDVPVLAAVIDAVLGLADHWTLRPGDPEWARTRAMDECAGKLREAIARELTAERGDGA
jgi:hypothetical protein